MMDKNEELTGLLRKLIEQNNRHNEAIISLQKKLLHGVEDLRTTISFQSLKDKTIEFLFEDKLIRLFVPDADHDFVQRSILRGRCFYEAPVLRKVRESVNLAGKSVIDIGANIGNHTVFFSKICKAGKCIAFEPVPFLASIARRNVEINHLPKVEVLNLAVSDVAGKLSVSRHLAHNLGGTSFCEAEDGNIDSVRIDDLDLGHVDFIKIDVEGNAHKVLLGARETIMGSHPDIMIELFADEFDPSKEFLEDCGYGLLSDFGGKNYFFRHVG
ncbi:FkbM family methyltransferase [Paracoccus sp. (in: a-proteobacteria)]|nr:FkbM family methyltransferase [Paracoccus sp. (in: a-proteobacteria)]